MFELFKRHKKDESLILTFKSQMKSWQKVNHKMKWGIKEAEFDRLFEPEQLSRNDKDDGFIGSILCYGFGDDGSEGIQLLAITHPHFVRLMNQRKMPFMTFADYDVAPHGFYAFYDAVQMFCSQNTLGLGIGNIDRNYPKFGISEIQL